MDLIPYNPINPQEGEELAEKLNELLVDYQIYQKNLLSLHWNRSLKGFLDLSDKIHKMNQLSNFNIEQIAGKIMNMGYEPTVFDQPSLLPVTTRVRSIAKVTSFEEAISTIIYTSNQLLETVKEVFYTAAEIEEKQTMVMMQHLAHQLSFAIGVFTGVRLAQMN